MRIAIACQGGGSHTAFTAGVLKKLLEEKDECGYEVVALSGTSGGAICALLAWYGLLTDDAGKAAKLLDSFWKANSARSFSDAIFNGWLLFTNRLFANLGGTPAVSPYFYPPWGQQRLRSLVEEYADFREIEALLEPSSPLLLVGAVDALSGAFKCFRSHRFVGDGGGKIVEEDPDDRISVEAILASAAVPVLFRAMDFGGGVYWDGLFSQNPPVRELPDARPDEIWVVQVNPERYETEPTSMADILTRRNGLSGNLSLNQEIYFIEKINEFLGRGTLKGTKHRLIGVRRVKMLRDLDVESKLDRDPAFIRGMISYGEEQAGRFLEGRFGARAPRTG